MQFEIGCYVLDVDVQRTKRAYEVMPLASESCSCVFCRNYTEAAKTLPDEVRHFYEQFGIDICKPWELYDMDSSNNNTMVFYGGFYDLCGEIIKDEKPPIKIDKKMYRQDESTVLSIGSFDVFFKGECDFLPEDFPKPCFQMDFFGHLPWVIDTPMDSAIKPPTPTKRRLLARMMQTLKCGRTKE